MFIFTLLIVIIALCYVWLKWKFGYWARLGVPGPKPTLLVGNLGPTLTMTKHFGQSVGDWYKEFSDYPYFGYYKTITPAIIIRDLDILQNILIKDVGHFHANDFAFDENVDRLLACNPFMLSGEKWKANRAMLSPLFTTTKIKTLYPLMQITCEKFSKYVSKHKPTDDVDAKRLAAAYTTENVAMCGFSLHANSFEDPHCEFRGMGKKMFQPSFWMGIKFMIILFVPIIMKIKSVSFMTQEVDIWIRKLIIDNLKSREKTPLSHEDLLSMLVALKEKQGFSLEQLTGHAFSFFMEGFETSSTVLSFAMYQVAKNPEVQERLYEEVIEVLEKHGNNFTFEALQEMVYLDYVIQETMRINPVAFTMHKLCTKPYPLPKLPGQKEQVVIPAGMPVIVPIASIHNDPKYFENPERFDPDRFTEEEKRNRHKCAYIPFGEGPRMCMGARFAMAQSKVGLASIVKDFKIKVSPNNKPFVVDVRTLMLQARDGLLLNFIPRK